MNLDRGIDFTLESVDLSINEVAEFIDFLFARLVFILKSDVSEESRESIGALLERIDVLEVMCFKQFGKAINLLV